MTQARLGAPLDSQMMDIVTQDEDGKWILNKAYFKASRNLDKYLKVLTELSAEPKTTPAYWAEAEKILAKLAIGNPLLNKRHDFKKLGEEDRYRLKVLSALVIVIGESQKDAFHAQAFATLSQFCQEASDAYRQKSRQRKLYSALVYGVHAKLKHPEIALTKKSDQDDNDYQNPILAAVLKFPNDVLTDEAGTVISDTEKQIKAGLVKNKAELEEYIELEIDAYTQKKIAEEDKSLDLNDRQNHLDLTNSIGRASAREAKNAAINNKLDMPLQEFIANFRDFDARCLLIATQLESIERSLRPWHWLRHRKLRKIKFSEIKDNFKNLISMQGAIAERLNKLSLMLDTQAKLLEILVICTSDDFQKYIQQLKKLRLDEDVRVTLQGLTEDQTFYQSLCSPVTRPTRILLPLEEALKKTPDDGLWADAKKKLIDFITSYKTRLRVINYEIGLEELKKYSKKPLKQSQDTLAQKNKLATQLCDQLEEQERIYQRAKWILITGLLIAATFATAGFLPVAIAVGGGLASLCVAMGTSSAAISKSNAWKWLAIAGAVLGTGLILSGFFAPLGSALLLSLAATEIMIGSGTIFGSAALFGLVRMLKDWVYPESERLKKIAEINEQGITIRASSPPGSRRPSVAPLDFSRGSAYGSNSEPSSPRQTSGGLVSEGYSPGSPGRKQYTGYNKVSNNDRSDYSSPSMSPRSR